MWLHAGQAYDRRNIELTGLSIETLARGALVGTVEVVDVESFTEEIATAMRARGAYFGVWSPGSSAWRVSEPRRLATPIPLKGQLNLFSVPRDVEELASRTPLL
jgi:hypothetical protein